MYEKAKYLVQYVPLPPFPYFNAEEPVFLCAASLRFIFHFFVTFTNYLRVKVCHSPAVAWLTHPPTALLYQKVTKSTLDCTKCNKPRHCGHKNRTPPLCHCNGQLSVAKLKIKLVQRNKKKGE